MRWDPAFRLLYRLLGWLDPAIRAVWERAGLGNVIELRVPSRRTGRRRTVLIGLLRAGDEWYIGHPNGDAAWTRDVEAASALELRPYRGDPLVLRAVRLGPGDERERAIRATGQHPFPGNLIYRLGRGHVRAAGVYFRLESVDAGG
jgi:hypothetical protein